MPTDLGNYIRTRRLQLGLTQEELAGRIGKEQHYVSQVERGIIKLPVDENIAAFARALETTKAKLYQAAGMVESSAVSGSNNHLSDDPFVTFMAMNAEKLTPEVRDALLAIAKADLAKQSQED